MQKKIKVGSVSYLNAKPLIYGLANGMMAGTVELISNYPSAIANQLLNDEIDVGLVPVAIIPSLKEYHIVSDYCIGSDGEVASVCLFSDVPLDAIETILLDYQSNTSVALLKILLKEHWKISPVLIEGKEGYEKEIKENVAGLVIGDRAFAQRKISKYIYDLGTAWKALTGLSFIFAAWVSNKKLDAGFISEFNIANAEGFKQLDAIYDKVHYPLYDLKKYYTENISYVLDESKQRGMQLFLEKIITDTSIAVN